MRTTRPRSSARRSPIAWTAAIAVAAAATLTPLAAAQEGGQFPAGKAPVPRKSETDPSSVWAYLCLLIIAGAVIGANLMPSRRGHQD